MSYDSWTSSIRQNSRLVTNNAGPSVVAVVAGDSSDAIYWKQRFEFARRQIFRRDGSTTVIAVSEPTPKGNFLGILNAWREVKRALKADQTSAFPQVLLIDMVFGQGRRLSPFTQALGKRKSALPTLCQFGKRRMEYLNLAEACSLYSNVLVDYLVRIGFHGALVRWGDEILIPGSDFKMSTSLKNADVIRFVGQPNLDSTTAREKEWFGINGITGEVAAHFPRQDFELICARFATLEKQYYLGVNLGSLALTYDFLDNALVVFENDLDLPEKRLDCDPYVWVGLLAKDSIQWQAEQEYEAKTGLTGLKSLLTQYPEFQERIVSLRQIHESRVGRSFQIGALDFGCPLWLDMGLHIPLRKAIESLTEDSTIGYAIRDVFRIPNSRDANGNVIIRSSVHGQAQIRNSVVIDSIISDSASVLDGGVIVASHVGKLHIPCGGIVLHSIANELAFLGPHCAIFRSLAPKVCLPAGGRQSSVWYQAGAISILSNESILDYGAANYDQPILGNPISFTELDKICAPTSVQDTNWRRAWQDIRKR